MQMRPQFVVFYGRHAAVICSFLFSGSAFFAGFLVGMGILQGVGCQYSPQHTPGLTTWQLC